MKHNPSDRDRIFCGRVGDTAFICVLYCAFPFLNATNLENFYLKLIISEDSDIRGLIIKTVILWFFHF